MNGDESLGLRVIWEDDELLDRLSRREVESTDGLEALLATWTAQIDAEAEAFAERSGPLGLGAGLAKVARVSATRAIRIPSSRTAAVAAVLAMTMSSGGVAAALTGQNVPLVSSLITASRPSQAPVAVVGVTTAGGRKSYNQVLAEAATVKITAGDEQGALALAVILRDASGPDPAPQDVSQIAQIEGQIMAQSPTMLPTPLPVDPSRMLAIGVPAATTTGILAAATGGPLAPTADASISAASSRPATPDNSSAVTKPSGTVSGGSGGTSSGSSSTSTHTPVPSTPSPSIGGQGTPLETASSSGSTAGTSDPDRSTSPTSGDDLTRGGTSSDRTPATSLQDDDLTTSRVSSTEVISP